MAPAPPSTKEQALRTLNDLWESTFSRGARDFFGDAFGLGQDLFDRAGDVAGDVLDTGRDIVEGGIDLASDGVDLVEDGVSGALDVASDIAEDLPLVGGLFD